jgi:hypothetical protein
MAARRAFFSDFVSSERGALDNGRDPWFWVEASAAVAVGTIDLAGSLQK